MFTPNRYGVGETSGDGAEPSAGSEAPTIPPPTTAEVPSRDRPLTDEYLDELSKELARRLNALVTALRS